MGVGTHVLLRSPFLKTSISTAAEWVVWNKLQRREWSTQRPYRNRAYSRDSACLPQLSRAPACLASRGALRDALHQESSGQCPFHCRGPAIENGGRHTGS